MPIYTRTGDKGKTSLFSGQRVSKSALRVETYGTIDELNSAIGVAITEVQSSKFKVQSYSLKLKVELVRIQNDLLDIGSALANPNLTLNSPTRLRLRPAHQCQTFACGANSLAGGQLSTLNSRVKEFENFIDQITEKMPPLKNFILPGGGKTGAFLHLARAISRRAERRIVALNNKEKVDRSIIIYVNRLSDLLFTMARFANFKENKREIIWPAYAKAPAGKRRK